MSEPPQPRALDGLRVVDLTRVLGGPYATMILADHGADVIKVEPPQGDEVRDWGPPFLDHEDGSRDASYFLGVNRNKRSLALDIGHPGRARGAAPPARRRRTCWSRTSSPAPWRNGASATPSWSPRFPRLIHCRISGFGADGPLGGLPGYDAILQAMVGLMSVNGEPASGPLRIGTPVVDLVTGLYSVIGILMAVQERERSGRGQFLDMTLHDCGLSLLHPHAANYFLNGRRPMPLGNPHPNISPYSKFATATGDIFLAIGNDGQFRRLCAELDRPDLAADPRFRTNPDRVVHREALAEALETSLAQHDGPVLAERLLRAGLPAGPVLPVDAATASAHAEARGMVVEAGGVRALGTPIKMSRTPGEAALRPAPVRAAHDGHPGRARLRGVRDRGFAEGGRGPGHATPMTHDPSRLRSARWYGPADLRSFGHRSRTKQMGYAPSDWAGKPVIGILNTWSDINPCHQHFRIRAEEVKRGVWQAGGFPLEIPALALPENFMKPTTMLYRNLLAMEVGGDRPLPAARRPRADVRLRQDHAGDDHGRDLGGPALHRPARRPDAARQFRRPHARQRLR